LLSRAGAVDLVAIDGSATPAREKGSEIGRLAASLVDASSRHAMIRHGGAAPGAAMAYEAGVVSTNQVVAENQSRQYVWHGPERLAAAQRQNVAEAADNQVDRHAGCMRGVLAAPYGLDLEQQVATSRHRRACRRRPIRLGARQRRLVMDDGQAPA
jgi:hypothetical protein